MGQFDLRTDAALAQLNFEEIEKTPGGEFAGIIGDLLSLCGIAGPMASSSAGISLLQRIRGMAGASYASNLIYAITAVRNDLKDLRENHAELRERIESLSNDPKFAEAISALALRAMQTSLKDRLKRLARVIVNGVKENDLEPEGLDDMMRAAVELKDADIDLLRMIYDKQSQFLQHGWLSGEWSQQIAANWSMHFNHFDSREHTTTRASLARLQSLGLIAAVETMMARNGSIAHQPFGLLVEGKKFYEHLQEIGATK